MRDAIVPLGVLLALGFALRLIIAYVLLPGSGFGVDLGSFSGWATELARNGPWGLYERPLFVDYTPGYLYVLWALGLVSQVTGAHIGDLLKLPAIAADLGLALAVFAMAADLGASRRRALTAAGVVLLVPVTWFDSAIWAQVDSVGTLFLLLAVRELWRGRSERAAILTTIAAIIKPQFGILIPLAAVVIIRRHWVERPADGSRLGGGPIRLVTTTLAGLVTATLVCLPFGLAIVPIPFLGIPPENSLLGQIVQTAGGYPYATVNAYNPWALVSMDGAGLASAGTWIRDAANPAGPGDPFLAPLGIPAVLVGGALIVAAIVGLMVVLWRRHDDRRALLVALAVMAVAFFVLPTRVHERYLYPFFALGAILLVLRPRWAAVYALLAAANLANLYGILTLPFYDNPGLVPMLDAFGGLGARLGEAIRSQAGVSITALAHVGGFVAATAFLVRPVAGETERALAADDEADEKDDEADDEADAGDVPVESGVPVGPAPAETSRTMAADAVVAFSAAAPQPAGTVARVPPPAPPQPAADPPEPDERAPFDRSPALARERGGRLDRLDLWFLVVLVVAALFLRTFRLGEPMRMHFDEVYHARTATEFLQDWRYGEPHGIYEWTHPHLAKYAIAAGIDILGNNRVVATSDLGTAVRDAAIEPRWDVATGTAAGGITRGGERLYVATGDSLDVYDLRTRAVLARFAVPGAAAVAVDPVARVAYVGTTGGAILSLATDVAADDLRTSPVDHAPIAFAATGAPVERLWSVGNGDYLVAGTPDGGLVTLDAATAAELSRTTLAGRAEVVDAGRVAALVATPAGVPDPAAAAVLVASLTGGDAAALGALLARDAPRVIVTADLGTSREAIDAAIADGRLAGLAVEDVPRVAVADASGVTFLEPASGRVTGTVPLDAPATGLVDVTGLDAPMLYVASGSALAVVKLPTSDTPASIQQTVWMPGAVERVAFNDASQLVHVLGRTTDGAATTVYVVEPRGNSVFADAALPFVPAAWAVDSAAAYPSSDRQELLVFAPDGASAAVDLGQNAFAWRLPGVLAGALMAGLLFLLARVLFRRRTVAVLAGLFVLADGMLFAQSRIAMNDAYVALFIVAAVTLFAVIWTGAWRWRGAFWVAMPIIGLLLGLAFASKWVALYAIGGIGLLILLRSALGRALIVVGLAAIAATLGYMAISTGPEATTGGNLLFLLLMVALTLVASAVAVLHPVAWTVEEIRIAVGGPAAAGALLGLASIPLALGPLAQAAAVGLMAVGGAAAAAFWLAGRLGLGPLAPPPAPDDPAALLEPAEPAPPGWLRPGWQAGLPIAWAALCLVAIPVAVYVVSYLPWAALGNQIVTGWPAGHDGQTLMDLTRSMYDYHNNLRATHAAASPWWAWPANLKPVWFYQEGFAGGSVAAIYDTGNLVAWWLSIPALVFVAWQAFRRRSLALALVVIMFASLWLPWARIDRATFQYHYYTELPFVLLALAYFAAEVWHGPSRRTWLLARGAAAGALLAPVALWLFRGPLCAFIDVERANPGSQACTQPTALPIALTLQAVGLIAVIAVAGVALVWQILRVDRALDGGATPDRTRPAIRRIWLTLAGGVVALAAAAILLPTTPLLQSGGIPGEVLSLLLLAILGPLAWVVLRAASPRRFVVGLVLAAGSVFALFYPNISGLPLPNAIYNWYQGLLPTWLYPFQFPVNTDPAVNVPLLGPWPLLLFVAVMLAAAFVAYSAWVWRLALAERAAHDGGSDPEADDRGSDPDAAPS
jgi:4-amino-4-deoxy-L-arabinose transferase-like glycosyltransferase